MSRLGVALIAVIAALMAMTSQAYAQQPPPQVSRICPPQVIAEVQICAMVRGSGFTNASVTIDSSAVTTTVLDDSTLTFSTTLTAGSHELCVVLPSGVASVPAILFAQPPQNIAMEDLIGCGGELIEGLAASGQIRQPGLDNSMLQKADHIDTHSLRFQFDAALNVLDALVQQASAQRGVGLSIAAADVINCYYDDVFRVVIQSTQQARTEVFQHKEENTSLGTIEIKVFTEGGKERATVTFTDTVAKKPFSADVGDPTLTNKRMETVCMKIEDAPVTIKGEGDRRGRTKFFGVFVMFCVNTDDCKNPGFVQIVKCKDTTIKLVLGGPATEETVDRNDADFVLDTDTGIRDAQQPRSGPTFRKEKAKKFCFFDTPGITHANLNTPGVVGGTTDCTFRTFLVCDNMLCGYFEWTFFLKLTREGLTAKVAKPEDLKLPDKKKVNMADADFKGAKDQLNGLFSKENRFP